MAYYILVSSVLIFIQVALEVFETYKALRDNDEKVFTFVMNACRNETGLHMMSGNFQILPSTASNSGTVITVFGAFFFEATVKIYRYIAIAKRVQLKLNILCMHV